MSLLIATLVQFISIYLVLLIIRILLSWFQGTSLADNLMSFLSPITDPYLNIFRSVIPPIGMLDISSIIAIFALQILQTALTQASVSF